MLTTSLLIASCWRPLRRPRREASNPVGEITWELTRAHQLARISFAEETTDDRRHLLNREDAAPWRLDITGPIREDRAYWTLLDGPREAVGADELKALDAVFGWGGEFPAQWV